MVEPSKVPIRVVFDTNVLLQAMSNGNGPAGACVQAVRAGRIRLCVSRDLLGEFEDVASRPSLVLKLRLTSTGTASFIAELTALAEMIDPVAAVFAHPVDPKDTMVVNLALAAGASVITSRDRHLLSLRDKSSPTGAEFTSRFGFIEVLTHLRAAQSPAQRIVLLGFRFNKPLRPEGDRQEGVLPLHDLHFVPLGVAEADDFAAADGLQGFEQECHAGGF